MKKYAILTIVSIGLITSFFIIPDYMWDRLPNTQVTRLQEIDYTEYVSATGQVTQTNKKYIVTDFPFVVEDVLIKSGDTIKQGQSLVRVDRDATVKKAMQLSQYSSLAGLGSEYEELSYNEIYNSLPVEVLATAEGVIDTVSATKGSLLEENGIIASFVSSGDLVASILVPENKISDVAVGQPVEITGNGFKGRKYYGYVKSVSSSAKKVYTGANQETVVEVIAGIDNLDEKVKVGYTVDVRIITEEQKKISVVPYESIMQDDKGKEYVYVFNNGVAVRKDIETGVELSEGVEVLEGVDANEPIISTPDKVSENGCKVKVSE